MLFLSTPLHQWEGVSQRLPCLKLCWGRWWGMEGPGEPLYTQSHKGQGVCWAHAQAAFEELFECLPPGHVARKEVKIIHMLCTTWEESCSLLDPEKQSGGFLRAKARGVT